jgi:hypothetical protein
MHAMLCQESAMQFLPRWLTASRQPMLVRRSRRYEEPVLEEDEKPLGCGWFDSSHELMRGIVVRELELPLRILAQ